jgi:HEAT repeat protein
LHPIDNYRRLLIFSACACLSAALAGCADGPIPEMRFLNPWVREQWAADEREMPTYHRKVAELGNLRSQASRLSPAEQEQLSADLAARLQSEGSAVMRVEFLRTLAEFPTETARAATLAAMADESPHVRVAACKALGKQPTSAGFQAVSQAVASDTDLDVRIAAAKELGNFREEGAPQALRPAIDDNDPALQLAAMESLQSLTGRHEYGNSVGTWREYLDGGQPAPPEGPTIAETLKQYWYWY